MPADNASLCKIISCEPKKICVSFQLELYCSEAVPACSIFYRENSFFQLLNFSVNRNSKIILFFKLFCFYPVWLPFCVLVFVLLHFHSKEWVLACCFNFLR